MQYCEEHLVTELMEKLITSLYMYMPENPIEYSAKWLAEYTPDYNPKILGSDEYRILDGHPMFWVGAFDPGLRVFDIVMETPHGTSYNAYLLKGTKANVLFETVKSTTTGARNPWDDTFWDQMLRRLKMLLKNEKLDYIVCNHTEPDHSGSATRILKDMFPDATFVGTPAAIANVEAIGNWTSFKRMPIDKEGMSLDIGGYTLQFIVAPFLHWPDSMFTYIPEMETLVTCDVFGAHLCHTGVFDDDMTDRMKEIFVESNKHYYDCIFSPFKSWMRQGMDKIRNLSIKAIACSHGPVIRKNIQLLQGLYDEWSKEEPKKERVVIPYVSAYGYTAEMAQSVAKGVQREGLEPVLYNMVDADMKEVKKAMQESKGILFGVPTLVGDAPEPMWELALALNSYTCKDQYAACFGSYGWSGEGIDNIDQRLQQVRIKLPLDPLKFKFRASEADIEQCEAFGAKFAQAVKGMPVNERSQKQVQKEHGGKPKFVPDGRLRKWRCIVCGEIVISKQNPEICGACGADGDAFEMIGIVGEENLPQGDFKGKIVIIGASAAGVMAAKTIREVNTTCEVVLLSLEEHMPYYRPALSHMIANPETVVDPGFWICKHKWYKESNVDIRLQSQVTAVDKDAKTVTIKDLAQDATYTESYDRLIIACGSNNFNPFPNTDFPNVFGLRSFWDARAIMEYIRDNDHVKQCVIIGAGLLGIECAESLLHLNVEVKMIDLASRILPMQLSEGASDIYQKFLNESGIATFLGKAPKAFEEENGLATGVALDGGVVVEGQMIIFAIGVRANTSLATQMGLKLGKRGIAVDALMQTAEAGVYACGDCAECEGRWIPNWSNAIAQGKTAGEAAAGVSEPKFETPVAPYTLKAFGLTVYSVGHIPKDNTTMTIAQKDPNQLKYTKLFLNASSNLMGAVSLAPDQSMVVPLNQAVTGNIPLTDALQLLAAKHEPRPVGWQRRRRVGDLGEESMLEQRRAWKKLLAESDVGAQWNKSEKPDKWNSVSQGVPVLRRGTSFVQSHVPQRTTS